MPLLVPVLVLVLVLLVVVVLVVVVMLLLLVLALALDPKEFSVCTDWQHVAWDHSATGQMRSP